MKYLKQIRKRDKYMVLLFCLMLSISGCSKASTDSGTGSGNESTNRESLLDNFLKWAFQADTYEKASVDAGFEVTDKETLYEGSFGTEVLYLTLGRDEDLSEDKHTWQEINEYDLDWYEKKGIDRYSCKALVQFGNEEGPTPGSLGYGIMSPNAEIKISGDRASQRPQKSYRIKINAGSGSVSGVKTFVLSKSFGDPYRFMNKLCYDLLTEVDGVMSVRTRLIHLYVRDEDSKTGDLFVDYGLYTLVEAVNKRYFSNRNLDSSGEIYKVNDFDFDRYSDIIMQPTDEKYDKKKFDKLLEEKGSNDYSSLLEMLDAVNDESRSIGEIVNTYFDEDNVYTWMAFNILMDNKDTDTENYYLYSPTGSKKFYFVPWDNDGAMRYQYELIKDPGYSEGYEKGMYLYTDSVLFRRMLKDKSCVLKLTEKVEALHSSVLSKEHVSEKAMELSDMVKPYLYSLPDLSYARVTEKNYDILISSIPEQIDRNYQAYCDSVKMPWPFHVEEPERFDNGILIKWEESTVLDGNVTYDVLVSDSWDFKNVLARETDVREQHISIGYLEPGQYFVKVTAKSDLGTCQEAFEFYNTEKKTTVHGVMCFYIRKDGTIVKDAFG